MDRVLPIVIWDKHKGPDVIRRGPHGCLKGQACSLVVLRPRSESANVLRLRALGTLRDVELDLLVLVEGLVALRLDSRVVHENVVAAVLLRNEAEALLGVEPLDGALSHSCYSSYGGRNRHLGGPVTDAGETPSPLEKLTLIQEKTPSDHK